jgi:rhamnosyltransferase subunit B
MRPDDHPNRMTPDSRHIVITVFGSLGDLHPMMGLGLGLQARGHRVTIATGRFYQERIEAADLGFHPLRPELDMQDKRIFTDLFDMRRGPERLLRKYLYPSVRDMLTDLQPLLKDADFLVNSPLIFPGPILAEAMQLPWASVALQPMLYFSSEDPPIIPTFPGLQIFRNASPRVWKALFALIKAGSHGWAKEIIALRHEIGLPPGKNPIFDGQFSPWLNLALFSDVLGEPKTDWPPHTQTGGFIFYDKNKEHSEAQPLPEPVAQFLDDANDPPILFTLGSSAVHTAGNFYEIGLQAAKALKRRALFLAGENPPPVSLDKRMLWWDYAPYSQIFPHVAAVVHQGGVGTTAQVLRAGKPMLVVPYGFDQPDNAARITRLGVGTTLSRKRYTTKNVTEALKTLLTNPTYLNNASRIGEKIRSEDGVADACNQIEAVFARTTP